MTSSNLSRAQFQILRIKERAHERIKERKTNYVTHKSQDSKAKPLLILQLNCNRNHHVLQSCVDRHEGGDWNEVDVLCISEPPFDRTNNAIHAVDSKYKSFYWVPPAGLAVSPYAALILLNKNLNFDPTSLHIGRYRVALSLVLKDFRLTIHSIYIPCQATPFRTAALSDVRNIMINNKRDPSIILGDFNLHANEWGGPQVAKRSLKEDLDLIIDPWKQEGWLLLNEVGRITRFNPNGIEIPSVLDLAFASPELSDQFDGWKRLDPIDGTDHFPCISRISGPIQRERAPKQIQGLNWKLAKEMGKRLKEIKGPNFQDVYDTFKISLNVITKTAKRKPFDSRCKFMSNEDKQTVKLLRSKIRLLRRRNKKDPLCQLTRGRIRLLRNKVTSIYRRSKGKSLKNQIRQLNHNQIWKHLPIKKARKKLCAIKMGQEKLTDTKRMLEAIMDYAHPATASNPPFVKMDELKVKDLELTNNEVKMAINQLKGGTAAGHDRVGVKLVKRLYDSCPRTMEQAYFKVYQTGIIPPQWRETKLAILPKNRSSEVDITNIRVIGVPPVLARVYHNILRARLIFWITKLKVLDESQHGVHPGSSCVGLLRSINQRISRVMAKGSMSIALMSKVDIEKAFDNVLFETIIQALAQTGIPGKLTNNIADIMKDLVNFGNLEDTCIARNKTRGAIQGSPLSPILFSLLLADPLKKLRSFIKRVEGKYKELTVNFFVYLDDLILIVEATGRSQTLGNWQCMGAMVQGITVAIIETYQQLLQAIGLSISWSKLEHLDFPRTKQSFTISLNGSPLNKVEKIKILGVEYSSKSVLFNSSHAEEQANQGSVLMQDLFHLGAFVGRDVRKILIDAAIIKKIVYAASEWSEKVNQASLLKLQKTFRMCMLKAKSLKCYTPTLTAALESGILPANILLRKLRYIENAKRHGLYIDGFYLRTLEQESPYINFHPAQIPTPTVAGFFYSQQQLPEPHQNVLNLFTDASLTATEAGFAVLEPESHDFLLYKTHHWLDSFTLELMAVEEAILNIDRFRKQRHSHCIIFTDSQAAMKAILNPMSKNEIVIRIRHLMQENNLTDFIQLAWVHAHGDILNNQLVDILASVAGKMGKVKEAKIPSSILKRAAQEEVNVLMEEFYDQCDASYFKFFYPSWQLVKEFLGNPPSSFFRFVNSQEPFLRDFVFQMSKRGFDIDTTPYIFNTRMCECDNTLVQDSIHLVFECKILNLERREICQRLNISNTTLQKYRQEGLRDKNFYELLKNIQQIAENKLRRFRCLLHETATHSAQMK